MSDPSAWSVALGFIAFFAFAGFLYLLGAGLARAAARPRPTPPNAAPVRVEVSAPGRATSHYQPALRVHLCVGGCGAIVRSPGDLCLACFGAPAHRAEEITRQAWKGGAA